MQSPSLTPLSIGKPSEKSSFGRRTLEIFGERQALTRLMIVGPKTIFLNNEKKEFVTETIKSNVCDKCLKMAFLCILNNIGREVKML